MPVIETGIILKTLMSPLIWLVIIFFLLLFAFGGLWMRYQKKLEYPCLVIRKTGNGKIDVKTMKAGWFKSQSILMGLFDYKGEEELKTGGSNPFAPRTKIQAGSTIDFHEIKGKKGLICRRKDDDPSILVPITKMEIKNDELLAEIAPADYRDASVRIVEQAEKETRNRTQEIVQWVLMGGVILLVLIVVIMSYKFVGEAQQQTWDYVLQASRIVSGSAPPVTGAP